MNPTRRRLITWLILAVYLGANAVTMMSHAADIGHAVGKIEHCEVIPNIETDQDPDQEEKDGGLSQHHASSHCTTNYAFCVPAMEISPHPRTALSASRKTTIYRSRSGSVELHPPRT